MDAPETLLEERKAQSELVVQQTADVDWLTCTAGEREVRATIFQAARQILTEMKALGYVVRAWRFKGYHGWKCGEFCWGGRDDSDIVMMSGVMARENFEIFLKAMAKPTRIDLAITVTLSEPVLDLAWSAYLHFQQYQIQGKRCPKRFTFVTNNSGGQTLYVGSRFSEQYGRIYDKGREGADKNDGVIAAGLIWRYEVEFKAYRARRIATQLLQSLEGHDNVHDLIGSTVDKWFLSRQVPIISQAYIELPYSTEVSAHITDDDITLNWLSTQVKPSVQRLVQHNKGKATLDALGLSDVDIPF